MTKKCLICKKEFITYPYLTKQGYGKYCSRKCNQISQTKSIKKNCLLCGKEFSVHLFRHNEGRGNYCSIKCYSRTLWKGDRPTIKTIHQQIKKMYGRPKNCEICGKSKKVLDWANKDHKYTMDRKSWIRVCRSCHRKYDIKNNGYKAGYLNKLGG